MGGAEGKVAYIGRFSQRHNHDARLKELDTEGTFRPERICEIAERFGGQSLVEPRSFYAGVDLNS